MNTLINDYSGMLVSVLDYVLDRSEKHSPEKMFIDTKFSTISGEDFADDDPVRGTRTIYTWIQGRGLESLAVHYHWLDRGETIREETRQNLQQRILNVVENVLPHMETLRKNNNGRMYFMMRADGTPAKPNVHGELETLPVSGDEPANMAELFYVKALAAAAVLVDDGVAFEQACNWYRSIHRDIMANTFYNDQQSLDPKNFAVTPIAGRLSHSSKMIAISAAWRFLQLDPCQEWLDMGLTYIDYILDNHSKLPGNKTAPFLHDYDFWEFIDDNGNPWRDEQDRVFCDPGHALEFTGFGFKFLATAETVMPGSIDATRRTAYHTAFGGLLKHNFAKGFSPRGIGICKSLDALSGLPINSDCPWWSLPETMRAGAFAAKELPNEKDAFYAILQQCSDAFKTYYVREDFHQVAYQTIDQDGRVVDTIPATPDADPGYHTGLSLIDMLDCLKQQQHKT